MIRTAVSDVVKGFTTAPNTGDIDNQKAEKSDVIYSDNLEGGFEEDKVFADAYSDLVMEENDDEMVFEIEMDDNSDLETLKKREAVKNLPIFKREKDVEYYEPISDEDGLATVLGYQPGTKDGDDNEVEEQKMLPGVKNLAHQRNRTIQPNNESVSKTKYNELLTVARKLQVENKEFKTALKEFKQMLAESVVYNTNLTYMVKIITENSTTKDEKQNIMKRFDNVKTLKESKSLYRTILGELDNKKTITESLDKPKTSGGSNTLTESTVYVDQSTKRIKDLISRVENKDKF